MPRHHLLVISVVVEFLFLFFLFFFVYYFLVWTEEAGLWCALCAWFAAEQHLGGMTMAQHRDLTACIYIVVAAPERAALFVIMPDTKLAEHGRQVLFISLISFCVYFFLVLLSFVPFCTLLLFVGVARPRYFQMNKLLSVWQNTRAHKSNCESQPFSNNCHLLSLSLSYSKLGDCDVFIWIVFGFDSKLGSAIYQLPGQSSPHCVTLKGRTVYATLRTHAEITIRAHGWRRRDLIQSI